MSRLLWLLPAASVALVFLASLVHRSPVRFPRRFGGTLEEGEMRTLHRALLLHIVTGVGALALLPAAPAVSPAGVVLFVLALVAARGAGLALARRRPEIGTPLAPLLAPFDGAALLLDWAFSPLLIRGKQEPPPQGSAEAAYEQVLELTQRSVEQMMIPRSEVVWLRAGARIDEVRQTLRRRPHTRYPVFEGDFEQLVGMLELVDLLKPLPEAITASGLAHPAVVVPETMLCDDLLEKMRVEAFSAAVVVDEFGTFAGFTTREDVLETVVGDLIGEHEMIPVRVQRLEGDTYQIDATLRLDEFESEFGIALPEGDYETLAGLFLSRTHRIPAQGEKLLLGDVRLEVLQADTRRIRAFKVAFLKPPPRRFSRPPAEAQHEHSLPG